MTEIFHVMQFHTIKKASLQKWRFSIAILKIQFVFGSEHPQRTWVVVCERSDNYVKIYRFSTHDIRGL